jgi:hypothetical protein
VNHHVLTNSQFHRLTLLLCTHHQTPIRYHHLLPTLRLSPAAAGLCCPLGSTAAQVAAAPTAAAAASSLPDPTPPYYHLPNAAAAAPPTCQLLLHLHLHPTSTPVQNWASPSATADTAAAAVADYASLRWPARHLCVMQCAPSALQAG